MSNEQNPAVNDDLDAFSVDFFGQKNTPEPASSEALVEDSTDDAPIEEVQLDGNDTPVDETIETDEEVEKLQEEALKPKRNRFQERIDELTGKQRDAERRATDLEQRLQEAIAKLEQKTEPKIEKSTTGPQFDDVDENGEAKYPLGEYDPKFIRDLTRHEITEERKIAAEEERIRSNQIAEDKAYQARQAAWNEKLVPAKERYPDFVEKGAELIASLENKIDPTFNKFLTDRIMEMDHGDDVFYYLATNPEEAHSLISKGAMKAAIGLGHIEAKFIQAEAEKKLTRPKVSSAPIPPPTNKGNNAAHVEVPGDTDDLDAFASEFFKKRR